MCANLEKFDVYVQNIYRIMCVTFIVLWVRGGWGDGGAIYAYIYIY